MTKYPRVFLCVVCFVLPLSIIGLILFHFIGNQSDVLEGRAKHIQTEVMDSFRENTENYYSLVKELCNSAENGSFYYSLQSNEGIPESLRERITEFSHSAHVTFDAIHSPGSLFYPSDSCVFRKTVFYTNGDVYCWVDLVYSPTWESQFASGSLNSEMDAGIVVRLDTNWCIVKLYGY